MLPPLTALSSKCNATNLEQCVRNFKTGLKLIRGADKRESHAADLTDVLQNQSFKMRGKDCRLNKELPDLVGANALQCPSVTNRRNPNKSSKIAPTS